MSQRTPRLPLAAVLGAFAVAASITPVWAATGVPVTVTLVRWPYT